MLLPFLQRNESLKEALDTIATCLYVGVCLFLTPYLTALTAEPTKIHIAFRASQRTAPVEVVPGRVAFRARIRNKISNAASPNLNKKTEEV